MGTVFPWDPEERFRLMFGFSRDEVVGTGVDVETWVRDHASEGVRNVYKRSSDRMRSGDSLLPYWAPVAWIGKGRSKLAQSWFGAIEMTEATIRLLGDDPNPIATLLPAQTRVRRVPIWLGIGVRLDQGSDRWFVQPWPSISVTRAQRATRVFRAALAEAGVSS